MKRCAVILIFLFFLSGCESTYYDLVMDKSDKEQGKKDDAYERPTDLSRLNRYH